MELILTIPEGTTATCRNCGQLVRLDVTEGGGDPADPRAWDWGVPIPDSKGMSILGLDYGCEDSPDTDDEGVGSHDVTWTAILAIVGGE